ncbi:MAG: hypothetical protein LBJ67_07100 [Planctomycetaceae bacterium]|jgi:hypothetical protein|nr:hypothetical protein [Planctomycetaceae bacterium]
MSRCSLVFCNYSVVPTTSIRAWVTVELPSILPENMMIATLIDKIPLVAQKAPKRDISL